jgi:hypothetical protein
VQHDKSGSETSLLIILRREKVFQIVRILSVLGREQARRSVCLRKVVQQNGPLECYAVRPHAGLKTELIPKTRA